MRKGITHCDICEEKEVTGICPDCEQMVCTECAQKDQGLCSSAAHDAPEYESI